MEDGLVDAIPLGPYLQLIMLTSDRRSEWANARTDWLTPDGSRLEIPAREYKTGKPQVVPLSRQARAIVDALPPPEFGPYILSSLAGARPISDFSGAEAKLDALISTERKAALMPWVVQDLRRSMATLMERLGIALHIIEVCLGHTLKGIGATYRHYSYLAEKAAALQTWADELVPGSMGTVGCSTYAASAPNLVSAMASRTETALSKFRECLILSRDI